MALNLNLNFSILILGLLLALLTFKRWHYETGPVAPGGTRLLLRSFIRLRPGNYLDDISVPMFLQYGYTHQVKVLTLKTIYTAEPANIRAILSEQQSSFDMGPYRRKSFRPLVNTGLVYQWWRPMEKVKNFARTIFQK